MKITREDKIMAKRWIQAQIATALESDAAYPLTEDVLNAIDRERLQFDNEINRLLKPRPRKPKAVKAVNTADALPVGVYVNPKPRRGRNG